jgi:hypothetical protein
LCNVSCAAEYLAPPLYEGLLDALGFDVEDDDGLVDATDCWRGGSGCFDGAGAGVGVTTGAFGTFTYAGVVDAAGALGKLTYGGTFDGVAGLIEVDPPLICGLFGFTVG